jgi:hypothetical protein
MAKIAVGLLGEGEVQELRRLPQIGEIVFRAAAAFELAGIGKQQAGLPDEIQRDIGEPQVFLERWRMPDPLRQPLAQHQAGIGKTEHVLAAQIVAHRFLTSSGIA